MSDNYLNHEALDRLHVAECYLHDSLLEHQYINGNKELKKLVEDAMNSLATAYQKFGELSSSENGE